jgi:signal transduction histidine kinase
VTKRAFEGIDGELMRIPGAAAIPKWARSHFGENSSLLWRWLSLYVLMLALGLLGDVARCTLAPLPVIWAQILPELHYIGIVFAAIRFGAVFGFAAACVAGLLHTTSLAIACSEPTSQQGHLAMFAAVGLIAGLTSRSRASPAGVETKTQNWGESNRHSSLSDLGRMMPEVVQQFLTPIASIEGAGYVLAEADLSDTRRQEFVDIIRKECRRLELLVELLDFTQSRFSTYQEMNLKRLLDEIVDQYGGSMGSRVELRNATSLDLPRLQCDSALIKYALQILTTGAIRSIPHHGEVELSANLAAGKIVIDIKARAVGPSGAVLAAALASDHSEIDLVVVQQIIDRHRGALRVDPNSGGATISIILPLKSG